MADSDIAVGAPTDIVHFASADIDHARSVLNRFYYPIAVGVPAGSAGFGLDLRVIQLGPLTIGQLSLGAAVTLVAPELDAYHLTMPTTGRTLARHGGHEVWADPSAAAVFGPAGTVFTQHDAHSTEVDLKIERAALETELADLLGHPVPGPLELPPDLDLSTGAGLSWWRLVRLLRAELDHPETLIRKPLIADRLRHSLLTGLLLAIPHRYTEELTTPAPAGPPRAVQRVIDAIHDGPERSLSVADLAEIAGVSVRSLQEGFRRHVGQAPIAYLQSVRLSRARAMLLAADPAVVTVAAVAHRWGFAHLGRFSAVYRARFGESPSTSLRSHD